MERRKKSNNLNKKVEKKENTESNTRDSGTRVSLAVEDARFFENRIVPEFISTNLASILLGISENSLRIRVCRGQVPAYKFGRNLRFRKSEIENLFSRKD